MGREPRNAKTIIGDTKKAPSLFYKDRVATFKNFRYDKEQDATCKSEAVARAGFVCTGETSAKCVFCYKELEFEPMDDPWEEHKKRPDCEFVRIGKLDDTTLTISEAVSLATHATCIGRLQETIAILRNMVGNESQDQLAERISKVSLQSAPKTTTRRAK